jgi:hypothetical protein
MLPDRYYETEIREGSKSRPFYFYASTEGSAGQEQGHPEDVSWIGQAYQSAIEEFRERLQARHHAAKDGVVVTASEPREIGADEMVRQNPRLNVHVEDAIQLAKQEVGFAFHPIRMIWKWSRADDADTEKPAGFMLSDDTGHSGRGFSVPQLKNLAVTQRMIIQTYRDLLRCRSQKQLMDILATSAVSEGD